MEDIQDDRLKALYGLKAYRSGEKAYDGTKAGYKELQENSKKKNNNSQADATTANTQPNPSANTSSTTTGNNNPVNSGNGNSQPTTGNNSQTNTGDNTPANNNTKEKNEKVDNSFTATVGFSSSKQKTETTTSAATVRGSSLTSSGDINLIATGSGQIDLTGNAVDGDLNILGSSVSGNNVYLSAARDVSLKAQANTTDSIMKSSGGSYGFGASASLGPNSSVSYYLEGSKNSSNSTGHATTWTEAMVTGNANLTMISGRDTNLVGAQAHGDSINLNVGRNLNLASLQDVETYNEKNKSINGKIGIGMASNVGFNKGTMNSTYKSVNEQTGIFAGKGGFDVYVEGNTDLKGAVMASKAEAGKNRLSTGTLTFSDIENEAKYKAKSFGVNYAKGAGVENKDKGWTPNMGVPVSDEKTSTTHAAIAEGTIEIRDQANQKADITKLRRDTENAVNKLDQIFDKKTVQEK
ncbi:hemagglutinin repeat-containing protein, partial [Acetonema longum]